MTDSNNGAVVWQTGINPFVALELLASGEWAGTAVLGPDVLPAQLLRAKLALVP